MSPELWSKYADAVVEILAKEEGVSVSELISRYQMEQEQAEIARLKRVYPDKDAAFLRSKAKLLDEKGAIREIVAEASQLILTRESRFVEKLKAKDGGLCKKIIALAKEAIRKMQEVLRNLRTPDDGVSAHIEKHLDKLVGYFDEMMADTLDKAGYVKSKEDSFFEGAIENGKEKASAQERAEVQFQYIRTTKEGIREYKSDFGEDVLPNERVKLFKKRIATIFNLGMVRLKTDTKKIQVQGDAFTEQKNIYGDKKGTPEEKQAKINALYDLADILQTATYLPDKKTVEESYADPTIPPKNKAHEDVKYWYKFQNAIILDGVFYTVTFSIRDKGRDQYQYFIDFHENRASDQSHTVKTDLRRADQTPYDNNIPQNLDLSTENAKIPENSDEGQFQHRRVGEEDRQVLARAAKSIARSEGDNEIVKAYFARLEEYRTKQKELNGIADRLEKDNWGEVKGTDGARVINKLIRNAINKKQPCRSIRSQPPNGG